jgi:hypothetical protein
LANSKTMITLNKTLSKMIFFKLVIFVFSFFSFWLVSRSFVLAACSSPGCSSVGGSHSCSVDASTRCQHWTGSGYFGYTSKGIQDSDCNGGAGCSGTTCIWHEQWTEVCGQCWCSGSSPGPTPTPVLCTPSCSGSVTASISSFCKKTSYTVTATGINNCSSAVRFPTWSAVGGQDDIVWYTPANLGGGTFRATINSSSHPGDGNIITDVWILSPNVYCGGDRVTSHHTLHLSFLYGQTMWRQ